MIWYEMIWYEMIWYDMIWYDMIWYDMIWYDMIWYDMIWYDMILFAHNRGPKVELQCTIWDKKKKTKQNKTTVRPETKLKVQQ